ncbi:MAG TPA: glycosyltransferase [Mycobacteriales bacterium]|nr:glycosyltransferase [Mycobacteriales bacterium]HWB68142.1 glycosyltransferase [Mycobacteriales bacterium]
MPLLLSALLLVISATLTSVAAATVWWMLHAWRTPLAMSDTEFERRPDPPRLSFSLLVPARHEEAVLANTLNRLTQLAHPDFEVIAIVGHDDPATEQVARAAAARSGGLISVVVDHNEPKNKPKALNTALPHCRGSVIGVFDAEDDVDPRLLRVVDTAFRREDAHVVQGGVQLLDFRSSWFSLRNCLEYFFWFRSRLHLHARHGFIPLGGNTVFVRADLLKAVGGWDEDCLAEDCELGVRLSALGARIAVAYDPHLVTREETPHSMTALVKQRTRWNQGFLQVLRKGIWRELPTGRQRLLARFTLAQPFLQAFAGICVPASIAFALFARVPLVVALTTFVPAIPTVAMICFEIAGLREFCRAYYVRARIRDYLTLVVGTPVYQLLLGYAALRAVVRESTGDRGWEKTAHSGAHLASSAAAAS